jgi:hypothetical protein
LAVRDLRRAVRPRPVAPSAPRLSSADRPGLLLTFFSPVRGAVPYRPDWLLVPHPGAATMARTRAANRARAVFLSPTSLGAVS